LPDDFDRRCVDPVSAAIAVWRRCDRL